MMAICFDSIFFLSDPYLSMTDGKNRCMIKWSNKKSLRNVIWFSDILTLCICLTIDYIIDVGVFLMFNWGVVWGVCVLFIYVVGL
jgi:hypothetical protein